MLPHKLLAEHTTVVRGQGRRKWGRGGERGEKRGGDRDVLEMECKGNISHVCADVARMAACGLCPRRHLACVVHEMQEMQEALSMCRTRDARDARGT